MAASYAADPACSLLVLTKNEISSSTEEDETILAVANYKRLHAQNVGWMEAVRTHPRHRNKGIATAILRSIVDLSKDENDMQLHKNNAQLRRYSLAPFRVTRACYVHWKRWGLCNAIQYLWYP
jgi:GNAT superfamily N-acetyltransferase